jgi:hypothetical protein
MPTIYIYANIRVQYIQKSSTILKNKSTRFASISLRIATGPFADLKLVYNEIGAGNRHYRPIRINYEIASFCDKFYRDTVTRETKTRFNVRTTIAVKLTDVITLF